MSTTPRHRRGAPRFALCALLLLTGLLATSAAAAPGAACGFCGKNLIKNPGADLGAGITAVDAFGAVPGWTNEAGQFGAASYTFPNGWFSVRSKGPKARGKNYFFGGTTRAAIEVAGNDRQADDQAARGGRRQEGDAQRLARELRQELRAGPGSVRGCVRPAPRGGQDRPGHDHLGHRHAGEEPEHQGARRREAGDDRRVVRRQRRGLQARRGGRPLARPRLRRERSRGEAWRRAVGRAPRVDHAAAAERQGRALLSQSRERPRVARFVRRDPGARPLRQDRTSSRVDPALRGGRGRARARSRGPVDP